MDPIKPNGPGTWSVTVNPDGSVHLHVYSNTTLAPLFFMDLNPDAADHLAAALNRQAERARSLKG